jgi:uncharacterized protein YdiU (UPF0061 family)
LPGNPAIARWNLERLADALAMLMPRTDELAAALERYDEIYAAEFCAAFAGKLGLRAWRHDDAELLEDLFELMRQAEIDMTEFFRSLARLDIEQPQRRCRAGACYRDDLRQRFPPVWHAGWQRYAARLRQDGEPRQSDVPHG